MTSRAPLAFVIAMTIAAATLAQVGVPGRPRRHVVDRAGVVSDPRISAFDDKLDAYKQATSNEIAVYVDRALPAGATLEEFATATFNAWGLGQFGKNNGVLLVIVIESRQLRLEVGDGLRPQLTDEEARAILASMQPQLRREEYAGAIEAATDAIIRELGGMPAPKPLSAMNVREQLAARKAAGNAADSPKPLPQVSDRAPMSGGCAIFTGLFGLLFFVLLARWARRRALRRPWWYSPLSYLMHRDQHRGWGSRRPPGGGGGGDDDDGVGGGGRSSGGGASGGW